MWQFWIAIGLLWLAGTGLRLTVLAVPPAITDIQTELWLSGIEIGILSGLSIVLFGAAAVPGSLLIARLGAGDADHRTSRRWHCIGIARRRAQRGGALRGHHCMSAVLTNGLLVGETLPVMLTIPLLLPLVDNSWRAVLAFWSAPLVVIAVLAIGLAPASGGCHSGASARASN